MLYKVLLSGLGLNLCLWAPFVIIGQPDIMNGAMAFSLTSQAFKDGDRIPKQYTCDGADVSPPLSWQDAPAGTKSFALIMDDPDAPIGVFTHWVLYDLPADTRDLPEGVKKDASLAIGAKQGVNDFGQVGYGGPCPPRGKPHRYFFTLRALDTPSLNLLPKAKKSDVEHAMKGHMLGEAKLMGIYQR
jgi:hypothetical protein